MTALRKKLPKLQVMFALGILIILIRFGFYTYQRAKNFGTGTDTFMAIDSWVSTTQIVTEIITLLCIFVVICKAQSRHAETKVGQNQEEGPDEKGINQTLLDPSSSNRARLLQRVSTLIGEDIEKSIVQNQGYIQHDEKLLAANRRRSTQDQSGNFTLQLNKTERRESETESEPDSSKKSSYHSD